MDYGPSTWNNHKQFCAEDDEKPSQHQCKTCYMICFSPEEVETHKCKGSRIVPVPMDQPRALYIHGFSDADVERLRGAAHKADLASMGQSSGGSAADASSDRPPTASVVAPSPGSSQPDPAVEANKKKVEASRSGCNGPASSDILICGKCKTAKKINFCLFCGSSKEVERVKACTTCRDKQGGGYGKVTGKPQHISAGCIDCGGTSGLTLINICLQCKKLYGGNCFYNFCENL